MLLRCSPIWSAFLEKTRQARQADERYVSAATYHREHYWESIALQKALGSLSAACTIVDTVVYLRYKLGVATSFG